VRWTGYIEDMSGGNNLLAGYGLGAELALYEGEAFTFVKKTGYVFFNVTIDNNNKMTGKLGGLASYENKGACASARQRCIRLAGFQSG
jgi:hypothetical protein